MTGSVGAGIVHRFSCKRLDQREKERERERETESEKEQEKGKERGKRERERERERGEGPTGAACCCSNLHCRPAAITVRSLSAQLPAARQRFSITDLSHRAAPELSLPFQRNLHRPDR